MSRRHSRSFLHRLGRMWSHAGRSRWALLPPLVLLLLFVGALLIADQQRYVQTWLPFLLLGLILAIYLARRKLLAATSASGGAIAFACPRCDAPLRAAPSELGRCPSCGGALLPDRMLGVEGREASLRRRFEEGQREQEVPRDRLLSRLTRARFRRFWDRLFWGFFSLFTGGLASLLLTLPFHHRWMERPASLSDYVPGLIASIVFLAVLRKLLLPWWEAWRARRAARLGHEAAAQALEEPTRLEGAEERCGWLDDFWPAALPDRFFEPRPSVRVFSLDRGGVPVWLSLDFDVVAPRGELLVAIWDHQGARQLKGARLRWAPHGLHLDLERSILDPLARGDAAPLLAFLERLDALLGESEGVPASPLGWLG